MRTGIQEPINSMCLPLKKPTSVSIERLMLLIAKQGLVPQLLYIKKTSHDISLPTFKRHRVASIDPLGNNEGNLRKSDLFDRIM